MFTARFDESGGPYSARRHAVRGGAQRRRQGRRATARGSGRAVISLPRGRYAVGAYWRPCEGTCDAEDLPLDRCAQARVDPHGRPRRIRDRDRRGRVQGRRGLQPAGELGLAAPGGDPRGAPRRSRPPAVRTAGPRRRRARRSRRSRAPSAACRYARAPGDDRPQGAHPQARADRDLRQRPAQPLEGGPPLVLQGPAARPPRASAPATTSSSRSPTPDPACDAA